MPDPRTPPDPAVLAVARQAVALVQDGARVGLGTGSRCERLRRRAGRTRSRGPGSSGRRPRRRPRGERGPSGISMIEARRGCRPRSHRRQRRKVAQPRSGEGLGRRSCAAHVAASSRRQVILVESPEARRSARPAPASVESHPAGAWTPRSCARSASRPPSVPALTAPFHTDRQPDARLRPTAPLADGAAAAPPGPPSPLPGVVDRPVPRHPPSRCPSRTRNGRVRSGRGRVPSMEAISAATSR
jgi:hypothetical protein